VEQGLKGMTVAYSNHGTTGTGAVALTSSARFFHDDGSVSTGPAASIPVVLAASEVQVLVPA
jgi:hypothetical protein